MKSIVIVIIVIIVIIINIPYPYDSQNKDSKISFSYFNFKKENYIKGYNQIYGVNVKTCEENLLLLNKIMNQFKIDYWLSEGTALGAIRDKAIIPWDDDVDISFMYSFRENFVNNVLPVLLDNGFVVARILNNGNFIGLLRKYEKIDIDIVQENGFCNAGITPYAKTNKCNDILNYLNNINTISFLGTTFNVPSIDYLEYLYGPNWMIPSKKK